MKIKRLGILMMLAAAVLSMTSCKPRYKSRLEDPTQTLAANAVVNIDFDQLHNDVIENYEGDEMFAFIKDLDISGDNDAKTVTVLLSVTEDTSDDALSVFMSDLLKSISNAAIIQDSRYTAPTNQSFGSFYDSYSVNYTITRGEETVEDATVSPGEGFSYDPSVDVSLIEG